MRSFIVLGEKKWFSLLVCLSRGGKNLLFPGSAILHDTCVSNSTLLQGPQASDGHVEGVEPGKGEQRYSPEPDPLFESWREKSSPDFPAGPMKAFPSTESYLLPCSTSIKSHYIEISQNSASQAITENLWRWLIFLSANFKPLFY